MNHLTRREPWTAIRLENWVGHIFISPYPSTKQVYAFGQRRYLKFCTKLGITPFPLVELQLCKFVANSEEDGLQFSSIKGYLSAIRRLQIFGGMGDPFVATWPLLEATLCGVKLCRVKSKESCPRTRLPITPTVLHKLRGIWEMDGQKFDNIMLCMLHVLF